MSWRVIVDRSVGKELKRIPHKIAVQIFSAIELLSANPYAGDIEKMEGEEFAWRRRVGAYRIFYDVIVRKRTIHVTHVKRRSSKTY